MDTLRRTSAPDDAAASATRGIVELICGCMFSGKTTRLLSILREEPADAILIVKHNKDLRYSSTRIVTHDGAGCAAVSVTCPEDIAAHVGDATQVVAIDEGHFYDEALVDVCGRLAERGKRVLVTALDLDMWGRPFPVIERLKAIAGVVQVQRARCGACGAPATHTFRKTPIVNRCLVGGSADFEPRCRACWSAPPESPIDSAEMA